MLSDTRELSAEELLEIRAGESAWYWIAYGVAYGANLVVKGFGAFLAGVRYSSETMPGLK